MMLPQPNRLVPPERPLGHRGRVGPVGMGHDHVQPGKPHILRVNDNILPVDPQAALWQRQARPARDDHGFGQRNRRAVEREGQRLRVGAIRQPQRDAVARRSEQDLQPIRRPVPAEAQPLVLAGYSMGGYVAFEVGEVRNGMVKLEEAVLPCGIAAGLEPRLVLINDQEFTKTANCWGVTNNSKGTNTNRVVVFRKGG